MKRYATEFTGTFVLVFTIGMVVVGAVEAAPIAIGCVLMVMVYMGGHVSGAHYNPAVTVAAYVGRKMDRADVVPYVAAQILAAWSAATLVQLLTGGTFAPAPGAGYGVIEAVIVEVVFTFVLVLVIMNVAMSEKTAGNSYFGLAIGFTVLAGAYAVGPVSGGAFNPAVGIGPIVVDALAANGSLADLWIYVVAPVAGGLAAVPVFRLQNG